jgi:hypothetical protein
MSKIVLALWRISVVMAVLITVSVNKRAMSVHQRYVNTRGRKDCQNANCVQAHNSYATWLLSGPTGVQRMWTALC